MSLLPKSIHRCRRYPTKCNSGQDIPCHPPVLHCFVNSNFWWSLKKRSKLSKNIFFKEIRFKIRLRFCLTGKTVKHLNIFASDKKLLRLTDVSARLA